MLLSSYKNGDYFIILKSDGTKIRTWDAVNPDNEFPETIDVKITDFCDLNCPYCHESSSIKGKDADLEWLLKLVKCLPFGVELAIGGGNPLSHDNLSSFLLERKGINNLTVNAAHLTNNTSLQNEHYQELAKEFIEKDLIKGLGLSPQLLQNETLPDFILDYKNLVRHVIVGVHSPYDLHGHLTKKIKHLLLGYKRIGRGINYYNNLKLVDINLSDWAEELPYILEECNVAFDNLALEQLDVKNNVSKTMWDKYYMGNDGQFSMYLDAVKKEFAISSTSLIRFPCENLTIPEMFSIVKKFKKNEEK